MGISVNNVNVENKHITGKKNNSMEKKARSKLVSTVLAICSKTIKLS